MVAVGLAITLPMSVLPSQRYSLTVVEKCTDGVDSSNWEDKITPNHTNDIVIVVEKCSEGVDSSRWEHQITPNHTVWQILCSSHQNNPNHTIWQILCSSRWEQYIKPNHTVRQIFTCKSWIRTLMDLCNVVWKVHRMNLYHMNQKSYEYMIVWKKIYGVLRLWGAGTMGCWNFGVLRLWVLRLRCSETQVCWDSGVLRLRGAETQGVLRLQGAETTGCWDSQELRYLGAETLGCWDSGVLRL